MELMLNERSYLCNFISKYIPGKSDELWEMSEKITRKQRGLLLALCFQKEADQLKKAVEEIALTNGVIWQR